MSFLSNQPENINSKQGTGRNSLIRSVAEEESGWSLRDRWKHVILVSPRILPHGLGKWLLSSAPSTSPFNEEIPLCYGGHSEASGLSLGINRFTYVSVPVTLFPLPGNQPHLSLAGYLRLTGAGFPGVPSRREAGVPSLLILWLLASRVPGNKGVLDTLPSHGAATERLPSADQRRSSVSD